MRNPERIDVICARIAEIWRQNPDLRLGQIIEDARISKLDEDRDLFYIEDYDLIRAIEWKFDKERKFKDFPRLFPVN